MAKWTPTGSYGIRYREHKSRTTGVGRSKRPLRYYVAVYKWQGNTETDSYGWEHEHFRNFDQVVETALLLKQNRRNQTPPFTLRELLDEREQELRAREQRKLEEERANVAFGQIFEEQYLPNAKAKRRNENSWKREESLYRNWIMPVIGGMALRKIRPLNIESISKRMKNEGLSGRSIEYCLAVVRQVFQFALKNELYFGANPATGALVRRPKFDNVKQRALTPDEIKALFSELKKRSPDVHDIAMFSLHTGCRAGEVFSLTWGAINLFNSVATLIRTKSGKNREVYLDDGLKKMLDARRPSDTKPDDLIFPDKNGNKITRISSTFMRAVDHLGLNNGVTESIHRVTFHSLRRTYATWLAQDTDGDLNLHDIKELLGHASITTTERYLVIDRDRLKRSALKINKRLGQ